MEGRSERAVRESIARRGRARFIRHPRAAAPLKIRIKDRVFVRSLDDREFSEILGQIREICRFDPVRREWVLDPGLALARGWEVLRRIQIPEEVVEGALAEVRRSVDAELERMARGGTLAIFSPGRDRPPEPFERKGDYLILEGSRLAEVVGESGVEGVLELLRSRVRGYWREDLARLAASAAVGPGRIALSDHAEGLLVEAEGLTQDQLARLDDMFTIEVNVQTRSGLEARRARLAKRIGRARYLVPPFMYHHLKRFAAREGLEFVENVTWPSEPIDVPRRDYQLYQFQEEAVNRWEEAERFGTVVIPTGGGKTYVGMEAIARTRLRTLVCVVTVELATQWRELIESKLGVRTGEFSGREKDLSADVVVGIYNSVAKHVDRLRDLFGLVIFDEVHHVPASTFRRVAFASKAKYRLGLSATPERSDGNEHLIFLSSGDVVYKVGYRELVEMGVLARVEHRVIRVRMEPDERRAMMAQLARVRDENARLAVMKRHALRARAKVPVVASIVESERGRKILVFCEYVDQAEAIQGELEKRGIRSALMVGKTRERAEIFNAFRRCDLDVIVTTRVLDEGIDVPDADVAIIASGSGSPRQMAQRVGRVLRGRPGKVAKVYEVVTAGTIEEALAKRRRKALAEYIPGLLEEERRRRRRPRRLPL